MTNRDPAGGHGASVRRRTLLGSGAAATLLPLERHAQAATKSAATEAGMPIHLALTVNGKPVALTIDSRASLLDLLRERLQLTGTKKGCDHGQCGACTVHLDGRTVLSCLTLAAKAERAKVTTIEGLSPGEALHPVQRAFIDHDALQCGYCTPGQVMSAVACLQQRQATSPASIREFMSGNLCRCGAYGGIVAAIETAARAPRGG